MRRRISTLLLAVCGIGLIGVSGLKHDPVLLYNRTESAPIGWYFVEQEEDYSNGDRVAAWLSETAQEIALDRGYLPENAPVIKTIFAGPGDMYCVKRDQIIINNSTRFRTLRLDSKRRAMPEAPGGCRRLNSAEYLLMSDRTSGSFDSRYVGPFDRSQIIGKVVLVGALGFRNGGKSLEEGGARGLGAEGKIKEACTNPLLKPCLYIDFGCTKIFGLALETREITSLYYTERLHQFTKRHDCSLSTDND